MSWLDDNNIKLIVAQQIYYTDPFKEHTKGDISMFLDTKLFGGLYDLLKDDIDIDILRLLNLTFDM
jgi:hypothetical protein